MTVIPEHGLTGEQLDLLMRPLNGNRVQEHKGQAHLEAWDVRRWLTRVFGFTGWKDEILSLDLVHESVWPWVDGKTGEPVPGKHRATVVYRVTLRLVVKDVHGRELNSWEDVATGEAINQASVGDAHDLAVKAAVSQALKRCAVNLGDQFGLSLYNDGGTAPVIVRTVGHPNVPKPGAEQPAVEDAPVVGGEFAEQACSETSPQPEATAQPDVSFWDTDEGKHLMKVLHTVIAAKYGPKGDAERHAAFSKFTGRQITSAKQLTRDEVENFIAALRQQPDYAKPQPAPADENANFRIAEQLAQLPQTDPAEQLEEDLRDAVESSDNKFELDAAMNAATDARNAGKLSAEQYTRLTAAADQRAARGRQLAGAAV
ncbi:hypothetical protein KDL01_04220 [Actinospica durhamensis]|uniref:Rad52/22 family double-strand break repair protein n=1 Tax=Actinospica durhamensis TaxID=1508375 RepID=A0A941EKB6_9ACTN|nr:Rad52/Rad22 family DNA repair protein [Actinospica durhamensis]MBR7832448.1 hypothetical protein [Actinospica durhamensis]